MDNIITDKTDYVSDNMPELDLKSEKEIVLKSENDSIKDELMRHILGNNVAVSVGNYIFIPPLDNPIVTNPERTMTTINQSNYSEGYVQTKITIDGSPTVLMTHISRIAHEGRPPSISNIISVDKINKNDIKIIFKNEFPKIFLETTKIFLEHKHQIAISENTNVVAD